METPKALLLRWLKRTRESSFAHYTAEERYSKVHFLIGIPASALAAIVGTTVFASLEKDVDVRIKIAVGLISVIAAILTGLQTFLRYSERSDRHRKVAGQYASVRRAIEQYLVYEDRLTYDMVDAIRKQLDSISADAPNVPETLWKVAGRKADNHYFLQQPDSATLDPPPRVSQQTHPTGPGDAP